MPRTALTTRRLKEKKRAKMVSHQKRRARHLRRLMKDGKRGDAVS